MDLQHTFSSESCRSSAVNHNEGITLESPRKRQEVQEVMIEAEGGERKRRRLMDVGHVKSHRRQSDVPEEGEEIKSPKRKRIRVESEETQDYVKGAKGTDQEEAEEVSFVPIAIGVPQKLMFRCDHQCSEKNPQLPAGVVHRGFHVVLPSV